MGAPGHAALGDTALREGRWDDARLAFEASLADTEGAAERFGLATALWWLGDNRGSVESCTRAYSLFRRERDVAGAVECALWLAVTYKANFANDAAANGWINRAERVLSGTEPDSLHAWVWVTRAYRMRDLASAEQLTRRALDVARADGDVDLELTAASQLGLIKVASGEIAAGFALIDEAVAAALGGEPSNLGTIVYTCCDMLNACELVSDAERAAQWCQAADGFIETYGCPFLYAECRIYYGSILAARGRWADADRELSAGARITDGTCSALHDRALTRLAGLRIRQGRLEDAERLLDAVDRQVTADAEVTLSVAALLLARGDGPAASRVLERRWAVLEGRRADLVVALELLVDAHLATGDVDAAGIAADGLADVVDAVEGRGMDGRAAGARGRVALGRGDRDAAVTELGRAVDAWEDAGFPFEGARARLLLADALGPIEPSLSADQARRALNAFDEIGATRDADRAAALLRSLGVVARVGPKGVGTLTAREQEVLGLLAHGLSNPEIAARLHVSRKTAAHHVSNILSKLNVRNRTEAAASASAIGDDR